MSRSFLFAFHHGMKCGDMVEEVCRGLVCIYFMKNVKKICGIILSEL